MITKKERKKKKLTKGWVCSVSFLAFFSVLQRFKAVDDVLALDVSSQEPLFGTKFHSFRLINAYSTNIRDHRVHSVAPDVRRMDSP